MKARNKSISQPEPVFSNKEHKQFSTKQENGYNIPDDRYCQWLRINTDDNKSSSDTNIGDHSKGKSKIVQLSIGSKEIGTRGALTQENEDGGAAKRIGE
uniref:Uncharacterized protein n=1 Tax=Amphimedon queenslandica TaxID=400682 RepID=A0A1X7UUV9_AMPQE